MSDHDLALMERAVEVAAQARLRSAPNPWVGAVVRTADGRWYLRTGEAATINPSTETYSDKLSWKSMALTRSDKGAVFAKELSDDFYMVKPKDLALPQLVYANVANALFEDRAKIVGWIESHSGNAEMVARYQALLEQIRRHGGKAEVICIVRPI